MSGRPRRLAARIGLVPHRLGAPSRLDRAQRAWLLEDGALDRAHAVLDAVGAEVLEGAFDVQRPGELAGVGRGGESGGAGDPEGLAPAGGRSRCPDRV